MMDTKISIDEAIRDLTDNFKDRVLKVYRHSGKRAYIDIGPEHIVDVAKFLLKSSKFRFNIASGLDTFEGIEILYHFSHDPSGIVVSVRVLLKDKKDPHIDSIVSVTNAAGWIEREIHELFGVEFDGNSDLRPLLLPDDWPTGVYPMRKDYVVPKRDSRKK